MDIQTMAVFFRPWNPLGSDQQDFSEENNTFPPVICYSLLLNMAIEIVDLPNKNGDFTYSMK
jgi:hypothetical protein